MPVGKAIGEFSLKATTMTFVPGSDGTITVQANWEGSLSGAGIAGTILGTATFVGAGAKTGSYSWCGASYLPSGDSVTGTAQGSFESIGTHRWRTLGVNPLSDGRVVATEGELDLASRSWTGRVLEWTV